VGIFEKKEMGMRSFEVGDQVVRNGLKMRDEPTRRGEVVEVYFSQQNAVGQRERMYAVRWDDTGLVERGYLDGGQLRQAPLMIPTVWTTGNTDKV
jgi:hypothetical protein